MNKRIRLWAAGWLTIMVTVAGSVHAQSPAETDRVRSANVRGLKIPMMVWAAGVAADQVTTYQFSSQYHDLLHEENPLIRGLDAHPVWLVTAGTAIDVATAWASYRLLARQHPRLAKIVFYGAAAYRGYLAVSNARMMRQAQTIRDR